MEVDVSKLVGNLCTSILKDTFRENSTDFVLKSFSRPSARRSWTEKEHCQVVKRLKYKVFDKLLLRKWEWFSLTEQGMSAESRCLAVSYSHNWPRPLQSLQVAVEAFKECDLTEKEALLEFLWCLSDSDSSSKNQVALDDSGVSLSEAYVSLFEGVHRLDDVWNVESALHSSQKLFECKPGTGYRGWCSQHPLDEKRLPQATSLFGGLAHSQLADINTKLDLPRLSLDLSAKPANSSSPLKLDPFPCTSLTTLNFEPIGDTSWTKDCSCALVRHWEGWQKRCAYACEMPAFADCTLLSLSRLRGLGQFEYTPSRPADVVHQLVWDMDHLPTHALERAALECSGTNQALAGLLQVLMMYCRSVLTTMTECYCSELRLLTSVHYLLPLCSFVINLVQVVNDRPKALDLVDSLHLLAVAGQGGHFYPLLLSMLSHVLEPYFRFVEQWIFLGQLDWGVAFGIQGNQEALDRRDEGYWNSGYTLTSRCTPVFLSSHANTLLTAGKALNLLKLCSPKHPLCSGKVKAVKLKIYFSAEAVERVHQECHHYSTTIAEQIRITKKRKQEKLQAERERVRERLERQREEAFKEADKIRRAEQEIMEADRLKKQSYLHDLQSQIETAKMAKLERVASEKKLDAEMMEKLIHREKVLTQHEENLAAEARAELVAHYAKLSKEAELRQQRAEWKIKRMNLQEKRVKFLQSEATYWTESIADLEQLEKADRQSPRPVPSSPIPVPSPTVPVPGSPVPISDSPDMTVSTTEPASVLTKSPHPSVSHDTSCDHFNNEGGETEVVQSTCTSGETEFVDTPPVTLSQQNLVASPDVFEADRVDAPEEATPLCCEDNTLANSEDKPLPSQVKLSLKDSTLPNANEEGYPRLFSTRGHAPRSTIEQIIYNSDDAQPQHFVSSRGCAPLSTIQRLLYPLLSEREKREEETQAGKTINMEEPLINHPSSKFQDDFSRLGDPPLRDMLGCLLGPATSDELSIDSSFLSLYPLSALLETCIALPLITQSQLVNQALLDHFLDSCAIKTHFIAIKRFLLLEDGEFSHVLSTGLCDELSFGTSSRYLTSGSFLNPLLSLALESSLHGHCPEARRLSFKLKYKPSFVHTHALDALAFLELKYEVDWPINIVITSSMMDKYNKVFQLLLKMKRVSWALKNTFHHLRQTQELSEKATRQLQTYRHEFQHFVNIMQGYMANQLFSISWREFQVELSTKVQSLDELIMAHQRFVENAIFRCLLSKKAKPVMNIIQEVLSSILCFSFQSSLIRSSPQRSYRSMAETHKKFSEATAILIKVVSQLVARGYQPHLEDLLLRLNFNDFYGKRHHTPTHKYQ